MQKLQFLKKELFDVSLCFHSWGRVLANVGGAGYYYSCCFKQCCIILEITKYFLNKFDFIQSLKKIVLSKTNKRRKWLVSNEPKNRHNGLRNRRANR